MSFVTAKPRDLQSPPVVTYAHLNLDDDVTATPVKSGGSAYQFAQHKTKNKSQPRSNPMFRAPPVLTDDDRHTVKLLIQQGDEYFKGKDYPRAFEYYGRAVKLDPTHVSAKMKLADTAQELEQAGVAHDLFTERLNLSPDDKATRKKRLKLNQDWFKAMTPLVEKYQKKQELSDEEREGVKAFLKIASQLKLEINVDSIVLQSYEVEETKKMLDLEFNNKTSELRALPTDKKKQFIAAMDLRISKLLGAAQLPLGDPDFAAGVLTRLKEVVAHGYSLLKTFAAGDDNAEIKTIAELYEAKQYALSERYAEAAKIYRSLAEQGYLKFGAGDAAAGRSKLDSVLARVEGIQKEMETLVAKKGVTQKEIETQLAAKQSELQTLVAELPPGLADAHQFVTQVESAKQAHTEGLKKLGDGDVEKGRKIAHEKIEEGKKLNDEILAISKEIRTAAAQFKYGEISKLMKQREEKSKAAEALAKSLPSLKFVQSFMMLEQIEASEQTALRIAEQAEKAKQIAFREASFEVWSEVIKARQQRLHAEAENAWFVGGIGALFRAIPVVGDGKTRFHDLTDAYFSQLDTWGEAHHLVWQKKAATLKEALDLIEKSGSAKQQAVVKQYRGATVEGLNFDEMVNFADGKGVDAAKAKALLDAGRKLALETRTKRAAKVIFEMLKLIPDAKLASEADAELKKI